MLQNIINLLDGDGINILSILRHKRIIKTIIFLCLLMPFDGYAQGIPNRLLKDDLVVPQKTLKQHLVKTSMSRLLKSMSLNKNATNKLSSLAASSILWDDELVNDDVSGVCLHENSSCAMDGSGNYTVVWEDYRAGNGDIYLQRYYQTGTIIGANIRVNDDGQGIEHRYPAIASNSIGKTAVAWVDNRSGNPDIYLQWFDASGSPNGTNIHVNNNTGKVYSALHSVAVAVDGNGNTLVVWSEDYYLFLQRFNASGVAQGSNIQVNDDAGGTTTHDRLAIGVDGSGNSCIVWMDNRNGNYDIYLQRYDGTGASIGVNIEVNDDGGTTAQLAPAIAINNSGAEVVTWHDMRNGNRDIYMQRYSASGTAQGSNVMVNDDAGTTIQNFPTVGIDLSGNSIIAWYDYRNANIDIYLQRYDASGIAQGLNVKVNTNTVAANQYYPWVAVNSSGAGVISWQDYRIIDGENIYQQRINTSGSFLGKNVKVNSDVNNASQWAPSVGMDGSNNSTIVWEDQRNGNYDIYMQRLNASGVVLGSNIKVNDDNLGAYHYFPFVAVNTSGRSLVAWKDTRNGNIYYDVYIQFYDASGSPIGSNVKVNDVSTSASPDNNCLATAIEASGNSVVVWEDNRNGITNDIYMQIYNSSGTPVGSNIRVNDDAAYLYTHSQPSVGIDGSGNIIVTWYDNRDGNYHIYLQRYYAGGSKNGANIRVGDNVSSDQYSPTIAVTSSGTSVIVWEDYRSYDDIFLQRFDASGNPTGGNTIVNDYGGTSERYWPSVVFDGTENFLVAWQDYRNTQPDIVGQWYSAGGIANNGNVFIVHDGVNHLETLPRLAASGQNLVCTWQDNRRSKGYDVYAKSFSSGWLGYSIAAPTLLYPLDGATGIIAADSVRWVPVVGATSYHVQIGSSSDMTAGYFVNDTVTSNVHWVGPTTFNEKLYWHVSALNGGVSSPFSAIWGFTTATGAGPSLSAIPLSLDFHYVQVSSTSSEKNYSISGSNLTSNGSISITAPTGFEISMTSGSGYTTSISLPYSGNTLPATSIFVRFVPTSAISYNANIIHSGGGIASFQVSVSGIGNVAPGIPTGINAAAGNGKVTLKWNKNTESDFLRYRIYRNTLPASPIKVDSTVGGILDTVRVMSGLSNGTQYYFSVTSVDSGGLESAHSTEVRATPSTSSGTAPAAPQNLTSAIGNGQVTLKWNKNTESDFLRYRIYGGTSASPTIKIDSASGGNTDTVKVISGLANGTQYYFRITAVNNTGLESGFSNEVNAMPSAVIDNTPPFFTVSPYTTGTPVVVNANGQVSLSPQVIASASDAGSGISRMQVVYRNTSEKNWSTSALVYASSIIFSIPTSEFVYNNKPVGVNYRVGAWDNVGNVIWSPYNSIDIKLGPLATDQPATSMPAASQLSNKTAAYRIISVPYNLSSTNQQPDKFLSNFGPHTDNNISYARWRFQRWFNGQYQDYDQFSTESVVIPGAAFFFIVRDQGYQIVVQGASLVRSDSMFAQGIQLQSGWNLVGDPFTLPYPIDSLMFSAGNIRQRAYYSGSGSIGGWDTSSASIQFIQPWQGVALYVNNAGTLRFPSLGMVGLPKMSVASLPVLEQKAAGNWILALNAYRSDIHMRCEGSSLGMAQGANEGDDPYDSYIPPIVGEKNVAVYFKNADGAMMRDIRPLNEDGDIWEMRVVTGDAGATVTLQIGDKLNLPNPAFEAYLIDIDQKMAHNLKEIQSLEINSGNGIRNFRIVVGKKSYVTQNNAGVALTPSSMKLYANYPNPFNPETVIRYTIPDASPSYTVTLKIFNMLGQEITTLVNEQKSSGYYEVKWNALQQSSGIYFYQLSITDGSKAFREMRKMVFMK